MLLAQYAHRLPADYDITTIRARARSRGPHWDDTADLHFKAFLLREAGRHGAIANEYASLYLWRRDEAFRAFLLDGRFKTVTDTFGRPAIQTHVALDARRGHARTARFAITEEVDLSPDADLAATLAREVERIRAVASQAHVLAAAVGVDAARWRLERVMLSEREPDAASGSTVFEVLHLAKPLLDELQGP